MVARLPTEQEVVGSIPTSGWLKKVFEKVLACEEGWFDSTRLFEASPTGKASLCSVFWNLRVSFKAFRFSSATTDLRVLGSHWGRRGGARVIPGVKYGCTGRGRKLSTQKADLSFVSQTVCVEDWSQP